jgi:hypothetical protein
MVGGGKESQLLAQEAYKPDGKFSEPGKEPTGKDPMIDAMQDDTVKVKGSFLSSPTDATVRRKLTCEDYKGYVNDGDDTELEHEEDAKLNAAALELPFSLQTCKHLLTPVSSYIESAKPSLSLQFKIPSIPPRRKKKVMFLEKPEPKSDF